MWTCQVFVRHTSIQPSSADKADSAAETACEKAGEEAETAGITGDAGREAECNMGATLADPRPSLNGPWSAYRQVDRRL